MSSKSSHSVGMSFKNSDENSDSSDTVSSISLSSSKGKSSSSKSNSSSSKSNSSSSNSSNSSSSNSNSGSSKSNSSSSKSSRSSRSSKSRRSRSSKSSSSKTKSLKVNKPSGIITINDELVTLDMLNKGYKFEPKCVRRRSNFAIPYSSKKNLIDPPPTVKIDAKLIDKFSASVAITSPKLNKLFENIANLDKRDKDKFGKVFKHFIFTDIRSSMYGAKIVGSAFRAQGYNLGFGATGKNKLQYNKLKLASRAQLKDTEFNNFYILNSGGMYGSSINKNVKKEMLLTFNSRPDNIYGELVRFIILDSGYKEGIDLFDIKYVHIFEPQTTLADLKQVIGRGTRLCGQKGLPFDPVNGWPLDVFIYDLNIPENVQPLFNNSKSAFELYLKTMNFDISLYNFQINLTDIVIEGAVDHDLNININKYGLEDHLLIKDKSVDYDNEDGHGEEERFQNLSEQQSYGNLKQIINRNYSDYKWDKIKVENLCEERSASSSEEKENDVSYTNTQMFISDYFTPSLFNRGMLLWHSVGTGKTCTAILTASKSFERENYTIIWVSRSTLINDVWKNMFGYKPNPVCNANVRELMQHMPLPAELTKQKKLLSKSWIIPPLSYKQFTNLISKKNRFYKMLEKINGTVDPLRKTLIIIDEAHKLYGESDLLTTEQPNMNQLHSSLMNSYAVSGANSAKLLLMTATPITKDPMELIRLLNLCRPIEEQFPADYYAFKDEYLNREGAFENKRTFLNEIAGYVSYLDRSNDIRQFSQPKIHYINDEIDSDVIGMDRRGTRRLNKMNKQQVDDLNKENKKQQIIFNKVSKKMKKHYKTDILKKYKTYKINDVSNKKVKKIASKEIKQVIKTNSKDLDELTKELKKRFTKVKTKKLITSEALAYPEPYDAYKLSPYYNLLYKCGKSISSKDLNHYYDNDEEIQTYNDEIKAYKENIDGISRKMKEDVKIRNAQIKQHKISVKNGIQPPISKKDIDEQFKLVKEDDKGRKKHFSTEIKSNNRYIKTRKKQILSKLKKHVSTKKKQAKKEFQTMIKELRKENMELNEEALDIIAKQEHKLKTEIDGIIDDKLQECRRQDELEERAKREKIEAKERAKQDKLDARDRAKREKEAEKDRAKREKEAEKDRAKRQKELEKERIKMEKEAEKERIKRAKMEAKTKKVKGGGKRHTRRRY
jgi:hypothetical protein